MIVIGGAGFVGTAICRQRVAQGCDVIAVDRDACRWTEDPRVTPIDVDLLTDELTLPPGHVVLAAGNSDPRSVRPWQLVMDNTLPTARLLPLLSDRDVTLLSSVEVYGSAPAPQREATPLALPLTDEALGAWAGEAATLATHDCPPWRAAGLCRELADADPSGRWAYAMAKRAQELLVASVVPPERLTVFRVTNLFGVGQDRVVARLVRRALAGLPLAVTDNQRTFLAVEDLAEAITAGGSPGVLNAGAGHLWLADVAALVLDELDVSADVEIRPAPNPDAAGVVDTRVLQDRLTGIDDRHLHATLRSYVRRLVDERLPSSRPRIPVVIPPRPESPDVLGRRIQSSLWTGIVKSGPWTDALAAELRQRLELDDDRSVIVTSSGTAALRLAIVALVGPARPGDVAVVPSFTFAATAEVLVQLGYRLRFCDVRDDTWTLDADRLSDALAPGDVKVVMAVDSLGAPADYEALTAVCRRHGVPLVADSAPSLGGRYHGRPLGSQADAHAFSMSFAKVVSSGGSGGAVVLPVDLVHRLRRPVDWARSTVLGEVHAAAGLDLLERLDALMERRQAVAAVYADLEHVAPEVVPQRVTAGDDHAWVHWVARFTGVDRDRLAKELEVVGIDTKPYYGPVLHRQPWRGHAEIASELATTDLLHREALALPMSSELSVIDAERVFWSVVATLEEDQRRPIMRSCFPRSAKAGTAASACSTASADS